MRRVACRDTCPPIDQAFRTRSGKLIDILVKILAMRKPSLLYHLRSFVAGLLGLSDKQARNGGWWEIDLVLVFFAGVIVLGGLAWVQLWH